MSRGSAAKAINHLMMGAAADEAGIWTVSLIAFHPIASRIGLRACGDKRDAVAAADGRRAGCWPLKLVWLAESGRPIAAFAVAGFAVNGAAILLLLRLFNRRVHR